ncbi:hypothetical protein CBR_g30343 [Chara braunii]|uniref:PIH1 N-terminal domain-containing protein n=1 Tax=Chara braunii TaxID=69332 RepID=A0A388JX61_CHABU|nr:hypothetical protein CBR_g30343 [Chara braunii]|eukprot:GBG62390.1 hypothetical protein CBR_g30343 [Chara braunii]
MHSHAEPCTPALGAGDGVVIPTPALHQEGDHGSEMDMIIPSSASLPSGADPLHGNSEEVVPQPGFVIKTKNEHSIKVFVNVCMSLKLDAPGNWEKGIPPEVDEALEKMEAGNEPNLTENVRFPLSASEPILSTSKDGTPCLVYDVLLNDSVVKQAKAFSRLRNFLANICLEWIKQKYKTELDENFKVIKATYKGGVIRHHRIRVAPKKLISELPDLQDSSDQQPAFPLFLRPPNKKDQREGSAAKGVKAEARDPQQPPRRCSSLPSTLDSSGNLASYQGTNSQSYKGMAKPPLPEDTTCSFSGEGTATAHSLQTTTSEDMASNEHVLGSHRNAGTELAPPSFTSCTTVTPVPATMLLDADSSQEHNVGSLSSPLAANHSSGPQSAAANREDGERKDTVIKEPVEPKNPMPLPLLPKYTITYEGKPIHTIEIQVFLPKLDEHTKVFLTDHNPGPGVEIEMAGENPPLRLSLPFHVVHSTAHASYRDSDRQLIIRLTHQPYRQVLTELKKRSPHVLGALNFQSRSLLELD